MSPGDRWASGCSAAWQRASFGTKRSWVQIPPPRQLKHQVRGLIRLAGRAPEWFPGASWEPTSYAGSQANARDGPLTPRHPAIATRSRRHPLPASSRSRLEFREFRQALPGPSSPCPGPGGRAARNARWVRRCDLGVVEPPQCSAGRPGLVNPGIRFLTVDAKPSPIGLRPTQPERDRRRLVMQTVLRSEQAHDPRLTPQRVKGRNQPLLGPDGQSSMLEAPDADAFAPAQLVGPRREQPGPACAHPVKVNFRAIDRDPPGCACNASSGRT